MDSPKNWAGSCAVSNR